MSKTLNDINWELIFKQNDILSKLETDGTYEIKAKSISKVREARLMTKIDHAHQLPKIFKENNLSILPITRGSYIIGHFKTFHNFDMNKIEETVITPNHHLESLDYNNIRSEAIALNCCFNTGIIQDFVEEPYLAPTINGRMSSDNFEFKIDNYNNDPTHIVVKNSQIEIDGGFEGENSLSLIEAKNYFSDDFIIRQLFYPYKLWSSKISKKVKPIFITYSNGKFYLKEYKFTNDNNYNSIELIKEKSYYLKTTSINLEVIQGLLSRSQLKPEPRITFPQADDFKRVINLTELLYQRSHISKKDITTYYGFDNRQTDYYFNAGKYLGIFEENFQYDKIFIKLSPIGNKLMQLPLYERQIEYIKIILSFKVFNLTLEKFLNTSSIPEIKEIVGIMKFVKVWNINSASTYERRASTVRGWINWILNQIDE